MNVPAAILVILSVVMHPCRPEPPPDERVPVSAPAIDTPRPVDAAT